MPGHMYGAVPRTTENGNGTGNGHGHGNGNGKRNLQYMQLRPEHAYTFVLTRYLLRLSVPYVRRYVLSSPSVCPYTSLTYGVSFTSQQLTSVVAEWYAYRMSEIWGPLECLGIMGSDPRLMGTTKIEEDTVSYMADDTVRYRILRVPQPRFDWTETVLEFDFMCISEILA